MARNSSTCHQTGFLQCVSSDGNDDPHIRNKQLLCTLQNYYLYHDNSTGEWQRLAYDLKSAFATDRGFNGQPTPDYCVLDCAQWNSPLYCADTQHAQVLGFTCSALPHAQVLQQQVFGSCNIKFVLRI